MKKISLGYSPCPNDTFIFYALVHKKLKGDIEFTEILHDVETLNKMALYRKLDVTKISYHALGYLRNHYCLLHAGSALGRGCGPLIVTKKPFSMDRLPEKTIAIPGKMTTAYLLLKLFAPGIKNVIEMPFDRIMNAVSLGMVDAGLIIHEGRFTFPDYGLQKLIDLGEWWEEETGLLIPLGGIIAKRELGNDMIGEIDRQLRSSIKYAFQHREETWSYVKNHAQELDDEVIDQHIRLYVNDQTIEIGDGIKSVEKLLRTAEELHLIPRSEKPIFID
jgi:1,4-dihydroxy-6-naphthoate synthase